MSKAPAERLVPHLRRFDYDVTNSVNVSSLEAVRGAVRELFTRVWPLASFDQLWLAFHDFGLLFEGRMPGYEGCDTVYHDIQHTLDMTLATARLCAGYEMSVDSSEQLQADRAMLTVICALFHDSGYIRGAADGAYRNGAELTHCHVSRSAAFLRRYLPQIGLGAAASIAAEMVHFTGYEKPLDAINLSNPLDSMAGHLLGTADLIAQMADRCYLEKCRDRLYLEFVLADIAIESGSSGQRTVRYQSGIDLLLQTPAFYRNTVKKRLDTDFNKAYRYVEALYAGTNPYLAFIERNIAYLEHIIDTGEWPALRRSPPCFTVNDNPLSATNRLVNQKLAALRSAPAELELA
ncbi:MAG: hypothetical protein V2J12_06355 [Gammaproteobacteria bacterium]|jgi:hypothetical protein|nr:hypothetical protein [Gammaproteobacteria bacterium]